MRSSTRCGRCRIAARSRATFRAGPRRSQSFGLVVIDAEGNVAAGGDSDTPFSIQSISKVFTLTLALGKIGDRLWQRVGREPSGSPFNSIVQLEFERGMPRNPFINAGAIAVTDAILSGHQPREALGEILRFMRFLADDPSIIFDEAVAASEQRTGYRNVALANYMKSFGVLENPSTTRWASTSTTAPSPCRAGSSPCPAASWRISAPTRRPGSRWYGRAGAAHQCADADVRALRRLGGIRVSRGVAGQERRRRWHPRDCAGKASIAVWSPGLDASGNSQLGQTRAGAPEQADGWSIFGA